MIVIHYNMTTVWKFFKFGNSFYITDLKKSIDAVLKHISDQNKQPPQPPTPKLAIMDV